MRDIDFANNRPTNDTFLFYGLRVVTPGALVTARRYCVALLSFTALAWAGDRRSYKICMIMLIYKWRRCSQADRHACSGRQC